MEENFYGIFLIFVFVQTCVSVASSDKVLAEVGKKVSLPCGKETSGEIEWSMDNGLLIKYVNHNKYFGKKAGEDRNRFSVSSHITNDLSITDIKVADSATYTCQHGKSIVRTVQLFVFQVSVFPLASLLVSEDLVLELTSSSSASGIQVSWEKDGKVKSEKPKLEERNVQLNSDGRYDCRIKMDGGTELNIIRHIRVFGFYDFPPIVYKSGKNPVTIPWIFNFDVRNKPLFSDVHVEDGSISYSSQVLNRLSVTEGAVSWPENSDSKDASKMSKELSVDLLKPKTGKYQMEILLKIRNRKKRLTREVCVASLMVSDSKSDIDPESRVPLKCSVDCKNINIKLCWHQGKTDRETCGENGQSNFSISVTAENETVVTWTCSVTNGKERLVSANVTLAVKSDFLDLSKSLFWVTVGVGIFILLLIVVIITLVIARNRRMRRARRRARLLENLHQQRRCVCKGFSPQRLRENI